MSKCDKLLEKAKNSPNNFSFSDICDLAECFGYIFDRQVGSHKIYKNLHPNFSRFQFMNFQNLKGKAKVYQLRQLLQAIHSHKMKNKYAIQIFWSEEDGGFIAICQEFPGLSAFGESREALHEAEIVLEAMIKSHTENNRPLPEPASILIAA
jgi:predicted RNase H-like HicB family nuclease